MIRPGLSVFRRNAGQLQFGTLGDDRFVVEDRPGLVGLLRLLDGARDTGTVACLAEQRVPALRDDPVALIAALHREGILVDATGCDVAEPAHESESRSLLAQGLRPGEIGDRLARRSQSCVELRSAPSVEPLTADIAHGLQQAGIQTTRVADTSATATLVIGAGPDDRSTFRHLRKERMPHLSVVADGARVVVGPFVDPGLAPCVECLDLRRREWDPSWPAITPQFDAPLAYAGNGIGPALTTATGLAAAAIVTNDIVEFCDESVPLTMTRTITVGPGVHDRSDESTGFHPSCRCRLSPRNDAVGRPDTIEA